MCSSAIYTQASTSLNVPSDLCHTAEATQGLAWSLEVDSVINNCVLLYGDSPNDIAKELFLHDKQTFGTGQSVSGLCIVQFSSVATIGNNTVFNFGADCAEYGDDDANVMVRYVNDPISLPVTTGSSTNFRLPIGQQETLIVTNNLPRVGSYPNHNIVNVVGTAVNPATISIDRNPNQGQVFVCIIEATGNNATLAILDPKDTTQQSFTTDTSVFIIPIIKPQRSVSGLVTNLFYDVGDPRRNAQIQLEEDEGE